MWNVEGQNHGFGPLAKRRGKREKYASFVVLFVSFLAASVFICKPVCDFSPNRFLLAFSVSIVAVFISEMVRRMCLFVEEIQHIESRYNGSIIKVFKATFALGNAPYIALITILASICLVQAIAVGNSIITHPELVYLFFFNAIVVPLGFHVLGLKKLAQVEVETLQELENMNAADGLAWSYFYGYLKLVLPNLHRVIKESDQYRDKIKVKKLFILLPKNCFCYNTISECDERVILEGSLPELSVDRAGVFERRYKQTVYRIDVPVNDGTGATQSHYCIAEYATPLLTLYEMSKNPEAGMSKERRDRQCMAFLRKLCNILDEYPDTQGKYQLVLFSGRGNNISDILLEYLSGDTIC